MWIQKLRIWILKISLSILASFPFFDPAQIFSNNSTEMFVFLYPSALQQNTDLFPFSSFNSILSSLFGRKKIKKILNQDLFETLTLSPLGYLKTRIRWGEFDPPSKSHVLCPNMTNDTSLESSCALI